MWILVITYCGSQRENVEDFWMKRRLLKDFPGMLRALNRNLKVATRHLTSFSKILG